MITKGLNSGPGLKLIDYQILHFLGKGHFGKVYKVRSKLNNEIYSLKCIQKSSIVQQREFDNLTAEREVLSTIDHPYIVKMHVCFQTKEQLCFVTDFLEGNELFYHLRDQGKFDEETAMYYAAQIVLAVEHLHKNNIMYRDLKPENILLNGEGNAVLTDFGLAKLGMTKNKETKTICGTLEYIAPEIIENKPYDKSADWWSLGILLYEMLSGKQPPSSNVYKIVEVPVRMRDEFSIEAKSLINGLLAIKPHNRLGYSDLGSEEIKYHDFFKCINWNLLEDRLLEAPIKIGEDNKSGMNQSRKDLYVEELLAELDIEQIKDHEGINLDKIKDIQSRQKLKMHRNQNKQYRYFENFEFVRDESVKTKTKTNK
mmetsp:Transcript_4265/g.3580  ORF Transcript_4265/g.3580 Transcript_4265/m.3580 type:complete len:370 (+) Transcript_4265:87-1196(+)